MTTTPDAADPETLRVLLLEDNSVDARVLQAMLKRGQFEVVHCVTLGEAMTEAAETPPDLILADLSLPDGVGLVTFHRLLAAADGAPVVVVTGTDDEAQAREAVRLGAQDYLLKGALCPSELCRALSYAVERKRHEAQRVAMAKEIAQGRRLEAIGQLAAGVAHEINTPCQYVSDNLQFLQEAFMGLFLLLQRLQRSAADGVTLSMDELAPLLAEADIDYLLEEIPPAFQQSLDGLGRVSRIVGAMKEFAHPSQEEKVFTDLNHAIEATVSVAANEWKRVAEVETDLDPALSAVLCHAGEMNQVLLNLLINAAHAVTDVVADTGGKGHITLSTRLLAGGAAEIRIADTGCGIPTQHRDRIFEPFYTTKPVGRGTGQGLAIVYDVIVNKHGGTIEVQPGPDGAGTCFVLTVPLGGAVVA